MIIKHGKSHHRTTGDYFLHCTLQATCRIQKFLKIHTNRCSEVRWCIHTVSGYCYDSLHQWLSFCHCFIDRYHGIHIIHDTAGICRKHGGIDCLSGHCIDQHTLCTLWIFCLQWLYFDICFAFYQLLQFCDAFRFVVLNTDISFCTIKKLQHHFQSADQFFRLFQHDPVVGSQIWLTFCTIDQNVFDLFRFFR